MNEPIQLSPEDAKLREQLQRAVRSTPVPPELEAKVRAAIRESGRPRFVYGRYAMAATLAIACLGGVIAYHLGHLRLTTDSQESYITSVSSRVATILRAGLGDHIHCSVFRKYPKNPPSLEELSPKLSPQYRGLIAIVRKHVPAEFRLMTAHECRHRGRRFVHLALKSDSKLISLVLTRKQEGESFAVEEIIPALVQGGIPVYRAGVQRFEIAAFESSEHLAYVISDMSQGRNMELMLAMASEVKGLLTKLES
jgi:hypothetical protein